MSAVIDHDGLVLGHGEGVPLESVIDFDSTGRNRTAAKALHLMTRGAHVSGFVLRPDDGLSDVAIVSNGMTRFISQGEMQWLMNESGGRSIVSDNEDVMAAAKALLRGLSDMPLSSVEPVAREMAALRSCLAGEVEA
jgi:hypothetical protein